MMTNLLIFLWDSHQIKALGYSEPLVIKAEKNSTILREDDCEQNDEIVGVRHLNLVIRTQGRKLMKPNLMPNMLLRRLEAHKSVGDLHDLQTRADRIVR